MWTLSLIVLQKAFRRLVKHIIDKSVKKNKTFAEICCKTFLMYPVLHLINGVFKLTSQSQIKVNSKRRLKICGEIRFF